MSAEPDPWWTVLVDVLSNVGSVEERDPYGLVVSAQQVDGTPIVVEIVMTVREWHDIVSIPFGAVESAAHHVRWLVLNQPPDQRYLVYDRFYDLEPCDTADLPIDPNELRMQEIAAQYPNGIPGGGWYAYPPEDD